MNHLHTADDTDDMALVRRAQDGDSAAFGQLYARRNPMVQRYFAVRLSDRSALAQDLAGDVWEKAWRNLRNITYGSPAAWLITLSRNRLIDYLRSGRARLETLGVDVSSHDRPDGAQSVEDQAAAAEDRRMLLDHIRTLPEAQQRALVLTYFDGMDGPEAAAILGKTRQAVTALNLRARRSLAARIPAGMR
jgi:RNA polymerase sigma-70 factor (ECF subfamily)